MGVCVDLVKAGDHIRSLVPLGDEGYVVVDSCFVLDKYCYETMVFAADKAGNVLDWMDLDVETYFTIDEMIIGHKAMCKKWRQSNGI